MKTAYVIMNNLNGKFSGEFDFVTSVTDAKLYTLEDAIDRISYIKNWKDFRIFEVCVKYEFGKEIIRWLILLYV